MQPTNYDDVLGQLSDAGLIIPSEGLRIGTLKPVRVKVEGGGKEKRGWYHLKEWSPSIDRLLIVGAYGIFRGSENIRDKIKLPKDDDNRVTPEQRAAMKKVWAEAAKAAELQRKQEADAAATRAGKAWAKLQVEGDSPYLARKGVAGYGVKYTANNSAVITLTDAGGKIHGLQFLRTAAQAREGKRPEKELWPAGLAMKGHFHLLGHQPHWIVLVAEGYATAASLHAATGYPVVVAFNAGNLGPVAEALRKRYKLAKILVCADDDILGKCKHDGCHARFALPLNPVDCPECGKPHGYRNAGIEGASAAALAVKGEWLRPVFADESGRQAKWIDDGNAKLTDFNDLHAQEGLPAVAAQVSARLSELRWGPPQLRAVSSSNAGEGAGRLRPINYLEDMLERFATVYGSNGGVFDRGEHALVAEADVKRLCLRGELFKAWLENPDRDIVRQDEVGFDPAECDPAITCNLWGGWPTSPKSGNCDRLLELLQYMCSGERNSRELYEWVLKWVAYPLQHPGAKMKTTVVVHGPQGTGKNLFFETVMAIYGKYGRILDQDALTDKHNDWASRKLFLIADEVVAQAHRFEVKNKLKTLITGTWVRINPKHIAAYDEANHVNLVFLSNESMPVVLEEDDRRHCIIWTPPKKPGEFYTALLAEINTGGAAALHEYLLHLDLGDFNPGSLPPDTEAKRELIDLAQDSPVDFIDALFGRDIPPLQAMPGLTQDWFRAYQKWCANSGVKAASEKRFVNSLWRKRRLATQRKGFLQANGQISNPRSMITFGYAAPEGKVESTWLGDQVDAMRKSLHDFLNGNDGTRGGASQDGFDD